MTPTPQTTTTVATRHIGKLVIPQLLPLAEASRSVMAADRVQATEARPADQPTTALPAAPTDTPTIDVLARPRHRTDTTTDEAVIRAAIPEIREMLETRAPLAKIAITLLATPVAQETTAMTRTLAATDEQRRQRTPTDTGSHLLITIPRAETILRATIETDAGMEVTPRAVAEMLLPFMHRAPGLVTL